MNHLDRIISSIKGNNATLFIGAGMSMLAGLPSGTELGGRIKKKFNEIDQSCTDFMEICENVIDTPPYNRQQLLSYISDELFQIQLSPYHYNLTEYEWNAIFTTNFDQVIETAYAQSKSKRRCKPLYSDRPNFHQNDKTVINLYKVMGCMGVDSENGEMILSDMDFRLCTKKREMYFRQLFDSVKSGTLIYIGYSFKDKIATSIIKEVTNAIGYDKLPYSYMLIKDEIPMDAKNQAFFSRNKIIPIQCSIEEFFDYLKANYSKEHIVESANNEVINLKIKNTLLTIDQDIYRAFSDQFTLLCETVINSNPSTKDDFLMGNNTSWGAWKENWDFKRGCFDELYNKVIDLINSEFESNATLQISGMPGAGKTFLTKRLAYDLYCRYGQPVLWYNNINKIDPRAVATSIEKIIEQYKAANEKSEKLPLLKWVLIFDDASSNLIEIRRLKSILASRGRSCVFILSDRESEWNKTNQFCAYTFDHKYSLNENLSDDEFDNLIDYLYNNKYIITKSDHIKSAIRRDSEYSFFAAIYSLVHPSKKPLNEIIKDQYNNLGELAKRAYEYICCFSQYNFPINIEWLVRILNCSYRDFVENVLKVDAAKVIFQREDLHSNQLYYTHHRIIAQKTLEFFLNDSEALYQKYLEIFNAVELSNNIETEICENFLITIFSDNEKSDRNAYSVKKRVALFKAASAKQSTRTLLHHTGLLECADSNFEAAEDLLIQALNAENRGFSRGESDQNICTSLGVMYSKQALFKIQSKASSDVIANLVNQAEEYFKYGKHGDFPNVHAYHSHAYHWYQRGRNTTKEDEKLYFYGKSLEIITTANDNLNQEDLQIMHELEQEVWIQLGIEDRIDKISDIISSTFNSSNGYYLSGLYYMRKAQEVQDFSQRDSLLKNAFSKTSKALKKFPTDTKCMELRCKIYRQYSNFNSKDYYSMLSAWYKNSSKDNVNMMYEYGRMAFCEGDYSVSIDIFAELEYELGVGNNLRSKQKDTIVDENGRPKKYTGKITELYSKKEGFISPISFISQYKFKFHPIAAAYSVKRGDDVKFEIAFNLRGPIAINVTKA